MNLDGYILASFFTDKYQNLIKFWKENRLKKVDKGIKGTNKTFSRQDLGGSIALFSLLTGEVVWSLPVPSPNGFYLKNDTIYVNSQDRILITDHRKNISRSLQHNLFNDLHTLEGTNHGFLIVSSGLDLILEIDPSGNELYKWFGFEAGYTRDALGLAIDPLQTNINYNKKSISTLNQAIHINSAILNESENIIYATFFHQDQLVKIDRQSGGVTVISGNLNYPHSVRERNNNLMVASTRNNEVLEFSKKGRLINKVNGPFHWVRDYELVNDKIILVASANDNTIYLMDYYGGTLIRKICFDKEWGISKIKYLTKEQAISIFKVSS